MRRQQQHQFDLKEFRKPGDKFGGSLLKGNPKKARPLDSKFAIHLVLRAEKSRMRQPKVFAKVNQAVVDACKRNGVTLYKYANVGNHLHLLIKISSRRRWSRFIRQLTGRVAQIAQGLLGPQEAKQKFWQYRPFTRVVRGWQKVFRLAKEYIDLNNLEAEGFIKHSDVRNLRELRSLWAETS